MNVFVQTRLGQTPLRLAESTRDTAAIIIAPEHRVEGRPNSAQLAGCSAERDKPASMGLGVALALRGVHPAT